MVDIILLWCFLIVGIALFIFSLRRPPVKDWLLAFFMSAYFSGLIGATVESKNFIEYPINFLDSIFHSSALFEALLFPVINIYFYQSTYRSRIISIIIQAVLYTSVLTIAETFIRKYTNLIKYTEWNWFFTFISVFVFLIGVRFLLKLIHRKNQ